VISRAEIISFPSFLLFSFLALVPGGAASSAVLERNSLERDYEPVVFTGESLSMLSEGSIPLDELYGYSFTGGKWRQIVLQVDEKNHEGDYFKRDEIFGHLDGNDEVVFMSFELGDRVDAGTWLDGADSTLRYEVEVEDPTDGNSRGWAYFYRAIGIPRDTTDYIRWSGMPENTLETDAYVQDLHDDFPHILSGYSIKESWGGSGENMLDRSKIRNRLFRWSKPLTEEDIDIDWRHVQPIDGPVRHVTRFWTVLYGVIDGVVFTNKNYRALNVVELQVLKGIIPLSIYSMKQFFDFSPELTGMIHYDNGGTDPFYNKDIIDGGGGGNPNDREPAMTWQEVDHPTAGSWLVISDLSDMDCKKQLRYYNDGGYVGGNDTGDGWKWGESGYEGRQVTNMNGYSVLIWTVNLPARSEEEGPFGPEFERNFLNPLAVSTTLQYPLSVTKDTDTPLQPEKPEVFCRPNPFNPSTTIHFTVPGAARTPVDLTIFDLSGNLVKKLIDGRHLSPGNHAVYWNGVSESGGSLSSGVYICRLNVSGSRSDVRIVLTK